MEKHSLTRCPSCQKAIMLTAHSQPTKSGWRRVQSLQSTAPTGHLPAGVAGDWERVTPVGRLEPRDITTAIYDAAVSFCMVTIGVGCLCWVLDAPAILLPAAGSGLAVANFRYFGGLELAKSLLEVVESITSRSDDPAPTPAELPRPHTVRVDIHERDRDGARYRFEDLSIDPVKLRDLATEITHKKSFSERTATGVGLTQEEFTSLRDQFISRGWANWNHPTRRQQGVSLTRGGKFIIQAIIDTPLPSSDQYPSTANGVHGSTQQHAAGSYQFINGAG